jgi:hypothetical protein
MYVAEEVSEGNLLRTVWLRTWAPIGTKTESVDSQKGTMLDIFARCLKKKIAQVCTLSNSVEHERGTLDQIPPLL